MQNQLFGEIGHTFTSHMPEIDALDHYILVHQVPWFTTVMIAKRLMVFKYASRSQNSKVWINLRLKICFAGWQGTRYFFLFSHMFVRWKWKVEFVFFKHHHSFLTLQIVPRALVIRFTWIRRVFGFCRCVLTVTAMTSIWKVVGALAFTISLSATMIIFNASLLLS